MNEQVELRTIDRGDIVQIVNDKHPWFPCLAIVDEVKSWGVQAYVLVPESNDGSTRPSLAWNSLVFTDITPVGKATVMPR